MNQQEKKPEVLDLTSTLTNEAVLIPKNVLNKLIRNLNTTIFDNIKLNLIEDINRCKNIEEYKNIIMNEAEFRNVIDMYENNLEKEASISTSVKTSSNDLNV